MLYQVEEVSFYSQLAEGFYCMEVMDFGKWFFAFIEMLIWGFSLFFCFNVCSYSEIHKPPCFSRINLTWSCFILYIYCWFWFPKILLKMFTSIFLRHIDLQYFFSCNVLVLFWYQSGTVLAVWESFPSSSILWTSLRRIDIISSLNVWQDLQVRAFGSGISFVEKFFF